MIVVLRGSGCKGKTTSEVDQQMIITGGEGGKLRVLEENAYKGKTGDISATAITFGVPMRGHCIRNICFLILLVVAVQSHILFSYFTLLTVNY